jgi:inosine-uridine nucleoside N-ribohydrolase
MPKNPALEILGYKDEKELKSNDFFIHLHKILSNLKDDEKFNIISTASQTNTAQYLLAFPEDAKKIRMIVMGGNFLTVGNIAPFAEFNIMIDPESVNLILNSGVEYIKVIAIIFFVPILASMQVKSNIILSSLLIKSLPFFISFFSLIEKNLIFFNESE